MMGKIINRIGTWIVIFTLAGFSIAIISGRMSFAFSLLGGGVIAWFGYSAHVQLIDGALRHTKTRWLKLKLFLRYGLIILAVYGIIRTPYFDITGFFIGVLLPAAAVLLESIWFLIKSMRGA